MTFKEFQTTRKEVASEECLRQLNDAGWEAGGLEYEGGLYVSFTKGSNLESHGKYCLTLERDEWVGDDLEDLEWRLYEWGLDAGNIDPANRTPDAVCALCRCIIPHGNEMVDSDGDVFCSETCRKEAKGESI